MSKKINLYLSGNMTPSSEYYETWADIVNTDLEETEFVCSVSKAKSDGKFIVQHDLARLKRCDIIIANLSVVDESHHLTGMVVELYEAFKQNKPVYAFTDKLMKRSDQANSPWMQQFITKEFTDYDDLINYLLWEENLPI